MRLTDRFDLTGRVAVVTAGPGGLGGGLALALGLAGAAVAVVTADAEEGGHVLGKLRAEGVDCAFLPADTTDPAAVQGSLDAVLARFGSVEVLVNTADVRAPGAALDLSAADWRAVMTANVDALWTCSQVYGRHFVAQGRGAIVNVGAVAGSIAGRPHFDVAFGASKAAVHHLTTCLAAEWAHHGVRVNALAPGYLSSDDSPTTDPRVRRHVLEDTPMERLGTVEEIAPAVVFLAADASSFITGSVLHADGGYRTA
ncbi:SDR family NAD(P)-dependent oxidoreductase [Kineococcus rubinsiae]|uniref:SDR family NAD(P)-dependent oxidoreductase n=1 Tax=Kineococcus rubinsiae TaxID=2609562 RepID=UPI00142FA26A|nr:SDR family oxidoreductase [Kineococcus rubinsiae]NIZ93403.1 SDR family oxidoreductase [Kineococcus rubinsiae]